MDPGGVHERFKELPLNDGVAYHPFRVPLHAQREGMRSMLQSLDDAIGSLRRDDEVGRYLLDRLVVETVDLDLPSA